MVYWMEIKQGLKFRHQPSPELDRYIGQLIYIGSALSPLTVYLVEYVQVLLRCICLV